jgi:hypothetical protein
MCFFLSFNRYKKYLCRCSDPESLFSWPLSYLEFYESIALSKCTLCSLILMSVMLYSCLRSFTESSDKKFVE